MIQSPKDKVAIVNLNLSFPSPGMLRHNFTEDLLCKFSEYKMREERK